LFEAQSMLHFTWCTYCFCQHFIQQPSVASWCH